MLSKLRGAVEQVPSVRAGDGNRTRRGWQISVWSDQNYLGLVDAFDRAIERNFGAGAGGTSFGMLTVTGVPNDSASALDIRVVRSSNDPCTDRYGCMNGVIEAWV